MKKALLITLIFFSTLLCANAYVEEVSTEPYADKFKPSSGLKIKESSIASKMEKATHDAAYGKKEKKELVRKRTTPLTNNRNSNVRSYKWF